MRLVLVSVLGIAACARSSVREVPAHIQTVTLPDAADAAVATPAGELSDEAALAVTGAELLVAQGKIKDPDAPLLAHAMRAAYARMRADEDENRVRVRDAARMWLEPANPGKVAMVFLHGYGGRFALPCWQLARAAGLLTACPSIGVEGDWWSPDGERAVRQAIADLREAGFARVILAGLSNGATGVARLAPRLGIDGVILISGADPSASPPRVPALVVQGKNDAMSSASRARAYAKKAHAQYVELDAGHFAMLLKSEDAERAIHNFAASF
jgi:pimeloyl-ACP methyl ester carboxylesterase